MEASQSNLNGSLGKELQGPEFCERFGIKVVSTGVFIGDDPTKFALPLLMLQLGLVTLLSQALHFILKPFGQPKYVSDFLGGIILGPSGIGRNKAFYQILFPPKGLMVLDVYEMLGIIVFNFLIGLKTDLAVVKRAGRLALVIGLTSFLLPMTINNIMVKHLGKITKMDNTLSNSLPLLAFLQSMINFNVISTILTDLKLVNSELGRLSLSSSMISSLSSWAYLVILRTINDAHEGLTFGAIATPICRIVLILVIIYAIRPIMFWMIRQTPEEKTLKESYVCAITLIIFGIALYSEVVGIHLMFSAIALGLAVPGGPPLASGLVEKLESFVLAVLLPSFIANVGRNVNVYLITLGGFGIVEVFVIFGLLGKIVGSVVPSLFWGMPLSDALLLGLLMCSQGIMDVQFFSQALQAEFIDQETFSIVVLIAILHSAVVTPLLRSLYDPSRRNVSSKKRTIQESRGNAEFRILACIHQEDNVPTIINILEASNPTRESPIGVYVLDLVELVGRAMPLFITHKLTRDPSSKSTRTRRIIGAFRQYEVRNQGIVSVQCFTSIAPYATIHDDICTLALEKSTSLVIISFNKSDGHSIRTVNVNVLENAPCSVGILVDQGMLKDSRSALRSWFAFHVCVIFIGGPDDREALVYGTRMAEHPSISLTVIRIIAIDHDKYDLIERKLDLIAVNQFKVDTMDNNRVGYKEEAVAEGSGTIRVLKLLNNVDNDLVLVGRRHDDQSLILSGLAEWNEIKELGIVGDILTSSDFRSKASVLVVQQHASVLETMLQSPMHFPKAPVQTNSTDVSPPDLERSNSSNSTQVFLAK